MEITAQCGECGDPLDEGPHQMASYGDVTLVIEPCKKCIKEAEEALRESIEKTMEDDS